MGMTVNLTRKWPLVVQILNMESNSKVLVEDDDVLEEVLEDGDGGETEEEAVDDDEDYEDEVMEEVVDAQKASGHWSRPKPSYRIGYDPLNVC